MKRDFWKLLICIGIGALTCHIKVMGCYPFVVAWVVAVYMEERYRTAFLSFMLLWMGLWLPISSLCRYGICILVWMVLLSLIKAMHLQLKRLGQAVLAGLVEIGISFGGAVFSATGWSVPWKSIYEGMLIVGVGFLLNRPIAYMWQWERKGKETGIVVEPVQQFSMAMSGLAKCMGQLVTPKGGEENALLEMKIELQNKMCMPCENCKLCFGGDGVMTIAMEELLQTLSRGEELEKELEERIEKQCIRAELLILEAVSIFEKTELNIAWYRRLCEHRQLIASQIDAMAYVMGDVIEQEDNCDDKERWRILKLKYEMQDAGVRASKIHFYKNKNGADRVTMDLVAKWGACYTVNEVIEVINNCMSTPLVSGEKNRSIVGKDKANYEFVSKPKLICSYGVAKMVQAGQEISGDSFRAGSLVGGKYGMVLSDGMGSGEQACRESESVVDLFWKFVEAGFTTDVALQLMNAAMIFGADEERYSTLDACLVDEYSGIVDFYKVGAHVSFIKRENGTEIIEEESLPMGASTKLDTMPNRTYLQPGDYLVMVTDGVLEYLHVDHPAQVLQELIRDLSDADAATFSRKIIERVLLFTGGKVMDDMTVLTLKTMER